MKVNMELKSTALQWFGRVRAHTKMKNMYFQNSYIYAIFINKNVILRVFSKTF